MKSHKLSALIATGVVSAILGSSAFADKLYSEGGNYMLFDVGQNGTGDTIGQDHQPPASTGPLERTKGNPLGTAAALGTAERQIVLDSGTKYVDVRENETVKLVFNGKAFAWTFDTLGTPNFDLSMIAPKDFGVSGVRVYLSPDPWLSHN